MFDFAFNAQRFAVYLIPTLLGIIMHEVAHGWMASRKGDQTARFMGRLTLNPVSHFDALGAAVFLLTSLGTGFIFGWAKPVPVNVRNLRDPARDMMWVALAGPVTSASPGSTCCPSRRWTAARSWPISCRRAPPGPI